MQTVTKNCKNCKTSFTITYYLTVTDEATDICNRCWNKRVSSYWTSTRDVLKNNHKSSHSYTDSLTSYSYSSKKTNFKPKSGIALYLDNLIPESKLKKKDKKKKKKEKKEVSSIVTTPNIPWLTNHSNGSKEPLMNSGLDHNVNSLLNKLKGA